MRPARLNVTELRTAAPLVAVAHGSKDPRAAATIHALMSLVRERAASQGLDGVDAAGAFLDHCAPSLPDVLKVSAELARDVVLVPLLLTAAYHSKTDIPAQVAAARAAAPGLRVHRAEPLGPHPLLVAALERRLAEIHPPQPDVARRDISVVLAAAGSADPAATATIAGLAGWWQASGGWRRVIPAFASAAGPSPADAVRALRAQGDGPVLVATYLLAPGYFADKIRAQALGAGATAVSAALGAAPEVADVILTRYACFSGGYIPTPQTPRPAAVRAVPPGCAGRRPSVPPGPLRGSPDPRRVLAR
jgi:sirohydrochlorin ferrochelatase